MSGSSEAAVAARAASHRTLVGVELRVTPAGDLVHAAVADHHVSVHAGHPVRVSCPAAGAPSIRTRGEVNVFPAGVSDAWTEDDESRTVDLRVPDSLVRRVAEEMGLDPDRAGIASRYHLRDARIEHIAWALEAERRAGFANGMLFRESLGLALAVHLLSGHGAVTAPRSGLSRERLRRVVDFVEAHLDADLSIARLAREASLSAPHFNVLFKRALGVPVHAYVVQRRVERAKTLLLRGGLTSGEVALQAGFAHQSHMARCMRRVLGVTPGAIARSRA